MRRGIFVIFMLVFCLGVVCAVNGSLFDNNSEIVGDESLNVSAGIFPEMALRAVELVIDKSMILINGLFGVSAIVVYENDSPVVGEDVSFYVNDGLVGENVTDDYGFSSIWVNGSRYEAGNYSVSVSGEGFVGGSVVLAVGGEDEEQGIRDKEQEIGEGENLSADFADGADSTLDNLSKENESVVVGNVSEGKVEVRNFDSMEVLDRGSDYNIYRGENGSRVARVSPGPVNYLSGDSYEPINTTIVSEGCEFDWCVREGVYWADFKEDSNSKDIVRFLFNGSYISYSPLDLRFVSGDDEEVISEVGKVNGIADNNEFVYSDIYGEGLSLGYEYKNSFLKENLIIDSLGDLPEPSFKDAYLSLDFLFDSKSFSGESGNKEIGAGDKLRENEVFLNGKLIERAGLVEKLLGGEDEEVEVKDLKWNKDEKLVVKGEARFNKSDGEGFAFRLPTPYAVDSNGSMIELEYVFETKNGETVVSVLTPYEWLADEERVFPVKVDPTSSSEYEDNYGECYYSSVSSSYTCLTNFGSDLEMGRYNDGGYYYLTRSFILWDFSDSFRSLLKEASVGLGTAVFDVISRSGSYPWMYIHEVSDSYVFNSPSPGSQSQSLFNGLDNDLEDSYYNPSYTTYPIDLDESSLESAINSDDNWIMGFVGYEGSSGGRVWVDKDASLWVSYTCDENSGCNQYCYLDNGVDCDCYGECTSGRCYGYSSGNYDCQSSGCAEEGEYAPQSVSCCSGLTWNSGTGECYELITTCGDGVKEGIEACDDDNTANGDGCSSTCTIESGYSCVGSSPSICSAVCGDGLLRESETCDDGDASSGDGCSSSCFIESGYTCDNSPMPSICEEIVAPTCNGEVNVFVEDSSGNPLSGVYSYLGGEVIVSDDVGFSYFGVSGDCGDSYSVQVKCSDQSTVCGSDSTRISSEGDVDSLYFVCDVCSGEKDIFIDEDSISFGEVGGDTNLTFVVGSIGVTDDFTVYLTCGELGTQSINLNAGESKLVSFVGDLIDCRKVDIILSGVDGEDSGSEDNNEVYGVFVIDVLKVKLNTNTGNSYTDSAIEDFLGDYVEVVSSGEDLIVNVGGKLAPSYDGEWGVSNKLVKYKGEVEGVPYVGMIGVRNGELYAFGNDIDGTIASVRRLVEEREEYLNERTLGDDMDVIYLGEENIDAISVFDYLHTDENDGSYRMNTQEFGDVVSNVLRKQTFNLAIKRVLTANDNTSLRMKNVNYEMSPEFKSFTNERPVVMSGGIFSNLFTWEGDKNDGLAVDLAENNRNVWEIEMTGGPNTECPTCDDYTYDDLVDYYWPALIAGVQYYSGEGQIDYVGHSNGCRVALSSLNSYQESGKINAAKVVDSEGDWVDTDLEGSSGTPIVDTFIGVACPAELNDETAFSGAARENTLPYINAGDAAMSLIFLDHVELRDYTNKFYFVGITAPDILPKIAGIVGTVSSTDNKISRNLMDFYNDLAIEENSDFDVSNLEVNKLRLHYGRFIPFGGDGIVPTDDSDVILNSVNSVDKDKSPYNFEHHTGIKSDPRLKSNIIEELTQ